MIRVKNNIIIEKIVHKILDINRCYNIKKQGGHIYAV
jgi:hypothetical protein